MEVLRGKRAQPIVTADIMQIFCSVLSFFLTFLLFHFLTEIRTVFSSVKTGAICLKLHTQPAEWTVSVIRIKTFSWNDTYIRCDRACYVAAARTWNSLPFGLRSASSLSTRSGASSKHYFLPEAITTASTAHEKLYSSCAANSVFSFDVVKCSCSHFDITPPKSVLWCMNEWNPSPMPRLWETWSRLAANAVTVGRYLSHRGMTPQFAW